MIQKNDVDKICIIGGSGFIGTRLIERIKSQFDIVNIDKRPSATFPELTIISDVRNLEDLVDKLKGFQAVVLLAAEHKDNIKPTSLYYDVNVQGARNVIAAMNANQIKHLVFTSSVAVYGLNKSNPDENHPADPFNHYGKSKWQAETVLKEWVEQEPDTRKLTIIRPTVVFGERNRGNVYNLLKQIAGGRFIMVGSGKNVKSMAYVGNVVEFINFQLNTSTAGCNVYNYIDKPDLNMLELENFVKEILKKSIPSIKLPYWMGMLGGVFYDLLAKVTGNSYAISTVRIKKFCATTQFDASTAHSCGFNAPFSIQEGLRRTLQYEFVEENSDQITFESE